MYGIAVLFLRVFSAVIDIGSEFVTVSLDHALRVWVVDATQNLNFFLDLEMECNRREHGVL